jgi:phosphoribosylanthranilate isomerase
LVSVPKVKICGITSQADADAAVAAGCDALGFVFYRKSPRYISAPKAASIISRLPGRVHKVGVFVNAGSSRVRRIASYCGLTMVQLHGEESAGYCRGLRRLKVIKAIRVKDAGSLEDIRAYQPWAFLFDSCVKGVAGGSGKVFDWSILSRRRGRIKQPVFLSGGLERRTVGRAIRLVRPQWVDVSSSVESSPGKKDMRKMEAFIKAVKKARA